MRPRIADSYMPASYLEGIGAGAGLALGTGTNPTTNQAIYVPVIFPFPCQIYSISFANSVGTTGNYDLGIYDGYSKARLVSAGTTAIAAIGTKTLTITPELRVDPGKLYYAAVVLSTTATLWRMNLPVVQSIALGMAQQATALPLPSTMTPATVTNAFLPVFVFGIR